MDFKISKVKFLRRIIRTFLAISLLIGVSSCEKWLDLLPPDGLVKDEYWKSKEDVKAVLMASYRSFSAMSYRLFYYGELRADMIGEGSLMRSEYRSILEGNLYPDNWLVQWSEFYRIINYCNTLLEYSPQVKDHDPTFSNYTFETYRSEAIFLRSLAYFYLVRIYKEVPFVLEASDTDGRDFFPQKMDGTEILMHVKEDLLQITQTLPREYENNNNTRGRATQAAGYALLADIALWNFNYEESIEYIQHIEENELYRLLPGGEWFTIFSDGNTLEGIFELQFEEQLGQSNFIYEETRYDYVVAGDYALRLLDPEVSQEGIRGSGSLRADDKMIWKYVGAAPDRLSMRPTNDAGSANYIIYRLADIKLMKAEALTQLGRFAEALTIVNEIRKRAFMPPITDVAENKHTYEDLILEERAKELAFEGKRWYDLLRMGRRNNYERKEKLIEIIIKDLPATQKRVMASKLNDPYGWYWPILQSEIENNPNLSQNPYYQSYGND